MLSFNKKAKSNNHMIITQNPLSDMFPGRVVSICLDLTAFYSLKNNKNKASYYGKNGINFIGGQEYRRCVWR